MLWLLAADHAIADTAALHQASPSRPTAARAGRIVTFGMRPTAPETGYGYIAIGAPLPDAPGAYAVARFVEKPDAARAATPGDRRPASVELRDVRVHRAHPAGGTGGPRAGRAARGPPRDGRPPEDLDFIRLGEEAFAACPSISLDYAVAERTSRAAVVPADIGWSDVGSWGALWELGRKDAAGNVAVGDVLLEAARNCYVRSDGMVAAVVGLEDAVVVVTEDAVLAMHRDHAQDVKKVVDRLKAAGRHEAVAHNRVYRPWGFFESLIQGDRFQVKRIVVVTRQQAVVAEALPSRRALGRGERLRARHARQRDADVRENESVYLPLGCVHRLENPGKIPLALIEVQSGAYLGEDDIVRLDDDYNRAPGDWHTSSKCASRQAVPRICASAGRCSPWKSTSTAHRDQHDAPHVRSGGGATREPQQRHAPARPTARRPPPPPASAVRAPVVKHRSPPPPGCDQECSVTPAQQQRGQAAGHHRRGGDVPARRMDIGMPKLPSTA